MSECNNKTPSPAGQAGLYGLGGFLDDKPKHLSGQGVKPKSEPLATKERSEAEKKLLISCLQLWRPASATVH
jgi:hypothetical protein